ncbi:MAG: DUF11 domain-containing protein [Chloroflexi bacterium]|nr:DUF11 domain-containing protein [Chloroflexota bacterium]
MLKKKRTFILSLALVVIALAVVSVGVATISWSADGAGLDVSMSASAAEFRVTYSITLDNTSSSNVGDVYVAGLIPPGASFVEATASPAGSSFLGKQADNTVAWLLPQVKAGTKVGPFSYKVSVSGQTAGSANAWASWKTPSAASALSNDVAFKEVAIDGPKRGCQSCHALRDENTGAVTIAYEAKVRGGENHPKLEWDTTVEQCLACHAPGTGERAGMGVVAPKMLRDIVHPVHMNSTSFTGTYKGNCFTCHNVNGEGQFELLGSKLKTDFRGIPSSPVKGIPPSESKR